MARSQEEVRAWKEQLIKDAEDKLMTLTSSEDYKRFLQTMASFNSYSFNNVLLIYSQREDASHVMGYKAWHDLDRQVNKGAKAIHIIAPLVKKLTEKEKEELQVTDDFAIRGYKTIPVFDVKDTSGRELKYASDLVHSTYSTEESDKFADEELNRVVKIIESKYNIPVKFQPIDGGVNGYYDTENHSITINKDRRKTEQLKTTFHEFAHSQLHNKEAIKEFPELLTRGHMEAQAESVAYLTMQSLGIDTSDYSIGYISTWAKDKNIMKQALKEIKTVFDKTFKIANDSKKEIIKQQEQAKENNENHSIYNNKKSDSTELSSEEIQKKLDKFSEVNNIKIPKKKQSNELRI